jgi:hypothetical protein
MGWFTRNMTVNFIDDATGAVFATTKMQPAHLPKAFERSKRSVGPLPTCSPRGVTTLRDD